MTAQKVEVSLSLKSFFISIDMQRKILKGNLTVLLTTLYLDFYLGAPHEPAAVVKFELCPLCSFRCWCHHVGVSWFICRVFILMVVGFLYIRRMSAVVRIKGCRFRVTWTCSGIPFGFIFLRITCAFPSQKHLYYEIHI